MSIAFWFLQNLYIKGFITVKEMAMIESAFDWKTLDETEKAIFVKFISDLGTCEIWLPKSVILKEAYRRVKVKLPEWLRNKKDLPKQEIKGQIIDETDKAILFRHRIDLAVWLPKSQIKIEEIKGEE